VYGQLVPEEEPELLSSVVSMGNGCFDRCWALTGMELPFIATERGSNNCFGKLFGTFNDAYGTSKDFSEHVPDKLTTLKLTNETSIRENAFVEFPLKKLYIPSSVISVSDRICLRNSTVEFYCEADSKPSGWDENWHNSTIPATETHTIHWGYPRSSFKI